MPTVFVFRELSNLTPKPHPEARSVDLGILENRASAREKSADNLLGHWSIGLWEGRGENAPGEERVKQGS